MTFRFDLLHTDGLARRGRMHTEHGVANPNPPAFRSDEIGVCAGTAANGAKSDWRKLP